jgi:hypothetical protein
VVGRVDLWTSVIPLEDWKIAVELTAIAHQLENFWKNVVAEETQERENVGPSDVPSLEPVTLQSIRKASPISRMVTPSYLVHPSSVFRLSFAVLFVLRSGERGLFERT